MFFTFLMSMNNLYPKIFSRILYVLAFLLVVGCSPESTSWVGKTYNNVTAHYNGYFYSLDEVTKIEKTITKSQADDYNRVLKLFPHLDSTIAKGYDKEAQEAIKMASLAIQHHPHSNWVDDAYILVGKARLYTLDWGNSIQTFKYVNTKSKDPEARHRAIINLIRTFVEHKEYNNAKAAIDYLQKEKLTKNNFKNFNLEKAYYYQILGDYDNMVRSLTSVENLLKKRDRRGRIYFIIGQVYQKLGFESEAYVYYKKCLNTNPEYEVDFYARLYMAQVTEITRSRDVNAARKSFKKLLKDTKNKEFKDKIYYEMGLFELKRKNLDLALTDLKLAVRTGNNKKIDGEAYLRLGELYYDTLKNYELSQAYYDSALSALPKDYEDYAKIKERAGILDEFVKNLKIIQWQDSLLSMANLDSVTLRGRIDSLLTAKRLAEEKNAGKKKKRRNRIDIDANTNNNAFATLNDDVDNTATDDNDWYYSNLSAVSLGQSEFVRVWGNISLEDNWRRSLRTNATTTDNNNTAADSISANNQTVAAVAKVDPVDAAFETLDKQLPRTDDQKKDALKKIDDAYFNLGDIYYFKLLEKQNASTTYKKLLERFPDSEHAAEVLYKLYLINKESDPAQAEEYARIVKEKYPFSSFAKILVNPDYLKESSLAAEKQKSLYKSAYTEMEAGRYDASTQIINEATALGQTSFSPNLELLKILILGKREDISKYQFALSEFIKTNPDASVTPYAQKLLDSSHDFQKNLEKERGIQYIKSFEESHYFVIVYRQTDKLGDKISSLLENFNNSSFRDLKLQTSSLILSEEYALTMVSELPRISYALEYYKTFTEKLPEFTALQDYKFYTFVITKDNFDIFYRTKGLDEYLKFFEKNYHPDNQ